jgi:hypothetical protein
MKNMIRTAIVMAPLALFACDKPQDAKPTDPATPAATAPAANATTTTTNAQAKGGEPVTITDTDLATPADFETAVQTEITAKNYKTEIASLEAEINKQ